MSTTVNRKIINIFELLKRLVEGRELYAQDKQLQEELQIPEHTLRRNLEEIHTLYGAMLITQKEQKTFSERKVTVYRVADKKRDVHAVLRFFAEHTNDISWLMQLVYENDPSLLECSSEKRVLERIIKEDETIFCFKNTPFEGLHSKSAQQLFSELKSAIKNREYRTIHYKDATSEYDYRDVKCLKLIFMTQNWYLACESEERALFLLRFSFIQKLFPSQKSHYSEKTLKKYLSYFKRLQNSFTLPNETQTLHLRASKRVAAYFKADMKPFFISQKFLHENSDGTVEFTIKYTQKMEVLPFVKRWLPDLYIVSPKELQDHLIEDLQSALENYVNLEVKSH